MITIDFKRIRSTPKSRNDSFEALSVLLFRNTCVTPNGSTFTSLRGEGGDGGVEAYFQTPENAILGIQAKYFFQLGAPELKQIKGSLETALSNHPALSEYWIYIPFDLTGRVASGKRGKSEVERFEEWKKDVEAQANIRGSDLAIKICTASDIQRQLLKIDTHGGIRRYWFDESSLTQTQIMNCMSEAIAYAGPRYTAELDIVTNAHTGLDFFGGIGDLESWRDEALSPVVSTLRSLKGWGDKSINLLEEPNSTETRNLIDKILSDCAELESSVLSTDRIEKLCHNLKVLIPLLTSLREAQEQKFYEEHGHESDTPGFRQFHAEYMCSFPAGDMDAAREWEQVALQTEAILTSQEVGAATTRSLLLVGPAGVGKTHAIVSAALRRLDQGGLSLVVFGDDFGTTEPWEVIRSKLGFGGDVSRIELFECLNACAEHTGLPFVIYIDALNESPKSTRWKRKLPELLAQCTPFNGIKICVSTRDTYKDLVVDARFPGFAFEHTGFSGKEYEAVEAFAAYYGLDTEITPIFSPELNNPLFLHLACKTLKDKGKSSLDISLPGFVALLEEHLKHCDNLIRERLQYSNPRNVVRAAMMSLSDTLTHSAPHERTWEACADALQDLVGKEFPPESLLNELQHEGLIILYAGQDDSWLVRLGYQRYGDVLRAKKLVESVTRESHTDISALAEKLASVVAEEEGLLEALAAVLPEKSGIEITSQDLGLDPELAHKLYVNSLTWRSRESISYNVRDHMYRALTTPGLWLTVYDVFFRLCLVPSHRLNAENWLDVFLNRSPIVDRDAFLSVAAFKSYDAKGAVWSLINAALKVDILRWPEESVRLAAISLSWLTSTADRRVRDLSAKALTRLFSIQPELCRELAIRFQDCDDDYIIEGIVLAIYSACLLERERKSEFIPALEVLVDTTADRPNVLIRDSVRLLGWLVQNDISMELRERLEAYPQKVAAPRQWPILDDAKPLLEMEGLPINMKLWGSGIGPDFWRYQVESKIRDFDLKSAGITQENIACWLMVQVLQLGYPGYKETALRADRAIGSEFGTGRSRKGYADRLGKKYYWILLHRLLGVLADNVPPKILYSDWQPGPDHLWSVDVRKADLTDVRDISPSHDYPDTLIQAQKYIFPARSSNTEEWVCCNDLTPHKESLLRASGEEEEWVALELSAREDDQRAGEKTWMEPYLGISLYYRSAFFNGNIPVFGDESSERDVFENQGATSYRGYIAEYPDCPIYGQLEDEGSLYTGESGYEFSEVGLLRGGEWEYDHSYTTPERPESFSVPCRSLVTVLGLKWDKQRGWLNSDDELVAFEARKKNRSGLFIRRSSLNKYLKIINCKLVYRRFANRGFFDNGGGDSVQIDIFTWLQYQPKGDPILLHEKTVSFNCSDKLQDIDTDNRFPF